MEPIEPRTEPTRGALPWAGMLLLTVLGVGLRFGLAALVGAADLQSDEANYMYLALGLERFGLYLDCYRYLWPPGYPAFLSVFFRVFDDGALQAVRVVQILLSASIGWSVMRLAWRMFGRRAALVSGLLWVLYLPLAAFTHLYWNESLFLVLWMPALELLLACMQEPGDPRNTRRAILIGLLLGLALYVKEAPIYLVPFLCVAVVWRTRSAGWGEAVRIGSLPLLVGFATILPWTLRNQETYGRTVLLADTLGENVYNGLNASYRNFDLIAVNTERQRRGETIVRVRPTFRRLRPGDLDDPDALDESEALNWPRAEEVLNLPDRLAENVHRGRTFAGEQTDYVLRSRVQKAADLVTPFSFFTRHLLIGNYQGRVNDLRAPFTLWAVLCVVLLLPLGWVGLVTGLRDPSGRLLCLLVFGYFLGTSLLVAQSRFRLPWIPLMLVGAGALLTGAARDSGRVPRVLAGLGVLLLLGLWWVGWPVHRAMFEMSWSGLPAGSEAGE